MVQTVLRQPDSRLRIPSIPLEQNEVTSKEMKSLIQDLIETMHAEHGVGIAAPQIGVSKRVIVIQTGQKPEVFFNPKILSASFRKVNSEEGCLSVPGMFGIVRRHSRVEVEAWNEQGENVRIKADGLPAIVFQHEIDHLDGILFIDKVIRFTTKHTL